MQPIINLYAVSARTSFLEGLEKMLKKEKSIFLAGSYRSFDSALKHIKLAYPAGRNANSLHTNNKIIFIDDLSLDKIQTLDFIKNYKAGFRLDQVKIIVYTNSIDAGYLRELWSSNVNAILHERETRLKDIFITEKAEKRDVTTYQKTSGYSESVQENYKLIEFIKAVNIGINCYDSIVRNFMSRRDKWAIDDTEAKSIFKNRDALQPNETSLTLIGKNAGYVQDLSFQYVNAKENEKVKEPNWKAKKIKALFVSAQSILIAGLISLFCDDPLIALDVQKKPFLNETKKREAIKYDVIIYDDNILRLEEEREKTHSSYKDNNNLLNDKFIPRRIVLTDKHEISHIKRIINCGVDGIISKHAENGILKEAIIKVNDGEKYYCEIISSLLFTEPKYSTLLTPREREVLYYLQDGLSYKEIAKNIFISPKTVLRHIEDIKKKLNLNTMQKLIDLIKTSKTNFLLKT